MISKMKSKGATQKKAAEPTDTPKNRGSAATSSGLLKLTKRGLSPFRKRDKSPLPASSSAAANPRQRGTSPAPLRSRGKSPFRAPRGLSPFRSNLARSLSWGSDNGSGDEGGGTARRTHNHNIVVCHESARSIVFRDHLRLAAKIIQEEEEDAIEEDNNSSKGASSDGGDDTGSVQSEGSAVDALLPRPLREELRQSIRESIRLDRAPEIQQDINELAHSMVPELENVTLQVPYVSERNVEIEGLHAHLEPFDNLELDSKHEFTPLLESDPSRADVSKNWTVEEQQVFTMLKDQKACVKTIKNSEWPSFLKRFRSPKKQTGFHFPSEHDDIGPHDGAPFNSFVTSTSLLPSLGQRMRCFGSLQSYPIGVVFALPGDSESETGKTEDQLAQETLTWSWPAGYAAKTEFNIDHKGRLINGRQEALVPLSTMRRYNDEYIHNDDHVIAGKLVKGGFKVVPYNEVFLRVGGVDRTADPKARSFDKGCGLFVALFIRSITVGDIIALFRTRGRIASMLGAKNVEGIPLLYISNEHGVRVFTKELQTKFLKLMASQVQPFQNPIIAPQVRFDDTSEGCLQQKLEESIDVHCTLKGTGVEVLSSTECARIAGGYGVNDESLLRVFRHSNDLRMDAREALAWAIRAGDYYSARQSLILYVLADFIQSGHDPEKDNLTLNGFACTFSDSSLLDNSDANIHGGVILPHPLSTSRLRRAVSFGCCRFFKERSLSYTLLRFSSDQCRRSLDCARSFPDSQNSS